MKLRAVSSCKGVLIGIACWSQERPLKVSSELVAACKRGRFSSVRVVVMEKAALQMRGEGLWHNEMHRWPDSFETGKEV